MAKGKHKNLTNRNQDHSASSKLSTTTTMNLGYPKTPEKQDSDLKSYLIMLVEDLKKDINNSLKERLENTAKQVEGLKEEAQKFLKELWENTTKQVMELNKTIQDLKKGSRNNKENPKGDNSEDRNSRKEIRNHRCEHQQQNIRDGQENYWSRRFHRKRGHSSK
jgi:glutamyl-tRNA reductase